MTIPNFWKSTLSDVNRAVAAVTRGSTRVLGKSAGNRDIHLIEYGTRDTYTRTANYISACGAHTPKAYKDNKHPHVVLVGGVHGAEWEGVSALINLMHIFETGKDLAGVEHPQLADWYKRAYIAIIPVLNPDGRDRVMPCETVVGMDLPALRHLDQGTWLDGTYCGWPECKEFQPITKYVKFMGGYYNDDGYNLMHDSFFAPKTNEVKMLMAFLEEVAPEAVIDLHGNAQYDGSHLLPAIHHPRLYTDRLLKLEDAIVSSMEKEGYKFDRNVEQRYKPNPIFMNLDDAVHLHCGAYGICYESEQGIVYNQEQAEKAEESHLRIHKKHLLFFRELDKWLEDMF